MAKAIGKRIRKFRATYTPDPNWIPKGTTPWGAQLYLERRPHGKAVPDLDDDGKQLWVRSEVSGQKLYKKNRVKRFTFERLFFLFDEGNGNVHKEPYRPPTPEEIEAARRAKRGRELMGAFEKYLGESDMTVDELMARLTRGPTQELEYATPEEVAEAEAARAVEEDPFVDRPPVPDTVAAPAETEESAEPELGEPAPVGGVFTEFDEEEEQAEEPEEEL